MSRSRSSLLFKALLGLLAVCCILAIYYSLNLFWLPLTSFQFQTVTHKNVYTASDMIKIFMVTDNSRMGGIITAINSIISNTRHPTHFYIVTDNSSAYHLWSWIEHSKLKSISYEINVFQNKLFAPQLMNLGNMHHRNPLLSYAKIFISKINPDLEGRWIFLDDDIIVQGDIFELANASITEDNIGVFSHECDVISKQYNSLGNKYIKYLNLQNSHLKALNIHPNTCVFSLGVYVLNMTAWNNQKITEQLEHWIDLNGKERIFNEPGPLPPMLVVLYNKTTPLDPSWHVHHLGVSSGSRYSRAFLKKAKLLHWDGHFKPWGKRTTYTDLWDKYFVVDPDEKFHLHRKLS